MTVVVTGASGHLGANLVRALLARGEQVRVLVHRDRRAVAGLDVEVVEGDICVPDSLARVFSGADLVYHAAVQISLSMGDWPLLERVNVVGTGNVVQACRQAGVRRLIHFSSIHALRHGAAGDVVDETCPLVDSSRCPPYDRSKAAAEREVRRGIAAGLDAVLLNPTAMIGPYDYRPSHFGQVLWLLAGGELPALVAGGFDWVDVRDVAEGAIRAAERAPAGAQYLLSGHWVSLPEIAAMVESISGVPAPRLVCPESLARLGLPFAWAYARLTGRRPLYTRVSLRALRYSSQVSHARATRELDYHPRPFRETLVDTLGWFAQAGPSGWEGRGD